MTGLISNKNGNRKCCNVTVRSTKRIHKKEAIDMHASMIKLKWVKMFHLHFSKGFSQIICVAFFNLILNIPWNRPSSWWCNFTTATIIHLFFPSYFYFVNPVRLYNNGPNLRQKTTNWRFPVVAVKYAIVKTIYLHSSYLNKCLGRTKY